MTKMKNTKKGMAKKALSISLVAAMLATSNVPVWAAFEADDATPIVVEDDGFVTEAPVEEEVAPVAEVESEGIETKVGENYTATVEFDKKAEGGWGNDISVKSVTIKGDVDVTDVYYAWMRDGVEIEGNSSLTNSVSINNGGIPAYSTTEADYNKTISLFLALKDEDGNIIWADSFGSFLVGARDISDKYTLTDPQNPTYTYDGTTQKPRIEDLEIVGTAASTAIDTLEKDDFTIDYTGDMVNVTDAGVTVTATPKNSKYTGVISYVYKIEPLTLTEDNIKNYVKATLTTTSYEYTGATIAPASSQVKLTSIKTGADLTALVNADAGISSTAINANSTSKATVTLKKTTANRVDNFIVEADDVTIETENSLTVTARDLSKCTVSLAPIRVGQTANESGITLYDSNKKELKDIDTDDLTVRNGTKPYTTSGTYSVVIVPADEDNDNYKNSVSASLSVYAAVFGTLDFTTDAAEEYATADEEYTGEAITKTVSKLSGKITGDGKVLDPADYEIVFRNNTNAGTAQILLKGKRSYSGYEQLLTTFEITPVAVKETDLTAENYVLRNDEFTSGKEYASAIGLTVTATNKAGKTFTLTEGKDKDYTVEYNLSGDEVQVVVSLKEDGNFVAAPNAVLEKVVTLVEAYFNDSNVTVLTNSYEYTAGPIIPDLKVVVNGKTLKNGTDYTVKSSVGATQVGTATVDIIGKGSYEGCSAKASFTVTPADTDKLTVTVDDAEYTGEQVTPGLKLTLNGRVIASNLASAKKLFDISWGENINAGKEAGTVTITPLATNKNFTGTKEVKFDIQGEELNGSIKVYNQYNLIDTNRTFEYDGTAHTYAKAIFTSATTVKEGVDYDFVYVDNVYGKEKNGKQWGALLVVGKGNYINETYSNTDIDIVGGVYEDNDGNEYKNVIAAVPFEIKTVTINKTNITVSNGTYAGGLPVKPVVKVVVSGKTLVEGTDYKLTLTDTRTNGDFINATKTKVLKVTVEGINGYRGGDTFT